MEKRYQVFVSSTYADLKEERRKVIQTLMEMDCIPAGMELFPAADEEQFKFIKKIIDDCDYYILIIGGRYGSLTEDGISFTEKEHDYAQNRGLKVMAFLHSNPDEIPVGKSDIDPVIRERLKQFRNKVSEGRLVKFWNSAEELPGLVALSLSKTITMYPAIGWMRADKVSNEKLLVEINDLRKENSDLKNSLSTYINESKPKLENLADIEDKINIKGDYFDPGSKYRPTWEIELSWKEIFALISPYLLTYQNERSVKSLLGSAFYEKKTGINKDVKINDQIFQTIKIQLLALNFIRTDYLKTVEGGMGIFWQLTQRGTNLLMQLRSIQK
jgi:hypothetical protein